MAKYAFNEYHLDVTERRLRRGNEEVRLRNKVFDTLCVLVENADRLVRKDDLMQAVWPDAVVEENNVDHCVSQLRKVLGGQPNQFIETVPRQSYRFVCPVDDDNLLELPIHPSRARDPAPPQMPPQSIKSFLAQDGVNIAYSQCGSGPPLVKAANWLNHLEFEWRSPIWRTGLQSWPSTTRFTATTSEAMASLTGTSKTFRFRLGCVISHNS